MAATDTRILLQTRPTVPVGRLVSRVVIYAVVAFGAILFSIPFIWMLSTSVKPGYEVFKVPPVWIPSKWEWDNYWLPWSSLPFLGFYRNTAIIAVFDILATLASSSIVAFAFARMRFRGRGVIFMLVLSTMMLPSQVTLIPVYVLWSKLSLVNTLWPLIIPTLFGSAFNIFL